MDGLILIHESTENEFKKSDYLVNLDRCLGKA